MDKTTLGLIWWPLMELPDIAPGYCVACGRTSPLERHHLVPRSAGELYRDGRRLPKPVVQLCGFGNNLRDADGRHYCHGRAHAGMLHFRAIDGELWIAETDEPTDCMTALETAEWRPA